MAKKVITGKKWQKLIPDLIDSNVLTFTLNFWLKTCLKLKTIAHIANLYTKSNFIYTCSCSVLNNQGHCPLAAFCKQNTNFEAIVLPNRFRKVTTNYYKCPTFVTFHRRETQTTCLCMSHTIRIIKSLHGCCSVYITSLIGERKQINQMHCTVLQLCC